MVCLVNIFTNEIFAQYPLSMYGYFAPKRALVLLSIRIAELIRESVEIWE
jgi:hypothetical protein